jgi:hypothetical protein
MQDIQSQYPSVFDETEDSLAELVASGRSQPCQHGGAVEIHSLMYAQPANQPFTREIAALNMKSLLLFLDHCVNLLSGNIDDLAGFNYYALE